MKVEVWKHCEAKRAANSKTKLHETSKWQMRGVVSMSIKMFG